jgi:hypothetical protein
VRNRASYVIIALLRDRGTALKPETTKQEQKRTLVPSAGRKIGLAQWVILFLGFVGFAVGVVMLRP